MSDQAITSVDSFLAANQGLANNFISRLVLGEVSSQSEAAEYLRAGMNHPNETVVYHTARCLTDRYLSCAAVIKPDLLLEVAERSMESKSVLSRIFMLGVITGEVDRGNITDADRVKKLIENGLEASKTAAHFEGLTIQQTGLLVQKALVQGLVTPLEAVEYRGRAIKNVTVNQGFAVERADRFLTPLASRG